MLSILFIDPQRFMLQAETSPQRLSNTNELQMKRLYIKFSANEQLLAC